jgi:hypothetical protein
VGLRAGLDTEDRGKIFCPCRGSNPDRLVVQSVARHYAYIEYAFRYAFVLSLPTAFGIVLSRFIFRLKLKHNIEVAVTVIIRKYNKS